MRKKGYDRNVYRSLVLISQFGINMLVPIVLCVLLGVFLDEKLNTGYWTVLLFFVGALAGFTNIFKMAKRIYRSESSGEHEGKDQKME